MEKKDNVTGSVTRAGIHLLGASRWRAKNIRREPLRDLDGTIRRAAIDNNQLNIGVVSKLAQSNRKVYFFVQSRNDDANDHNSPS